MINRIKFGDRIYDLSGLSGEGRRTLDMLQYTEHRLKECKDREDAFIQARNEYVLALREEIVFGKTGIDLNDFLSD